MTPLKNIIFDLDGTLTDPAEGITRSMQYALGELGHESPETAALHKWIGPPLRTMFTAVLGSPDTALIEKGVATYRSRYFEKGLFENRLYDGVPEMLAELVPRFRLFVATSKVQSAAERIVEHFGLAGFFAGVYGADLDGRFDDKADLLAHLLATEEILPEESIMVGDRMHDVVAATSNGMRCIGVTYGYGSREELMEHGSCVLCEAPRALPDLLASELF